MSAELVAGAASAADAIATAVFEVRGLSVRYGRRVVLDGVSLSVPRGAVYALLGRNGAGKSSLVRCLLGQQRADAGEARLFGLDTWRCRQLLMQRVGVVPEEPDAPPELTARELVFFCGQLNVVWDASSVFGRLERFQVPLRTPFHRLSKGEKGAVMLALALGHGPELLLLDEPTLGLDVVARRAVFGEVIGELAERGTTVFVTTHDLAGVEGIADRVGILHGGRISLEGDLEALKAERGTSLEEIFAAVAGERLSEVAAGRMRFEAADSALVISDPAAARVLILEPQAPRRISLHDVATGERLRVFEGEGGFTVLEALLLEDGGVAVVESGRETNRLRIASSSRPDLLVDLPSGLVVLGGELGERVLAVGVQPPRPHGRSIERAEGYTLLVALDTGALIRREPSLAPGRRRLQVSSSTAAAASLLISAADELVRLDAATGERHIVLKAPAQAGQ